MIGQKEQKATWRGQGQVEFLKTGADNHEVSGIYQPA